MVRQMINEWLLWPFKVNASGFLSGGDWITFFFSDHCMEDAILQGCPKLEIYNSNFTINFGEWALGFCGEVYDKDNPSSLCLRDHPLQSVTSLDLSNRCIHNLVNKVSTSSPYSFFFPFFPPSLLLLISYFSLVNCNPYKLNISIFRNHSLLRN